SVNGSVVRQGLFLGGGLEQLGRQLVGVLAATAFSFCASWLLAKAIDRVLPWRVTPEQEQVGLDQSLHAESAYDFGAVRAMGRR
ncbi:MAG: ammonia channel protein, partial [Frankiales bacterium]|nr:ammonia channel protein [Frankiales bacterium]